MLLDDINKKTALIFDMDGTLVDSMGMWKEIDIEYLGRFGYSIPDDLQQSIAGMCFHDTAVYFKNRFNIPDSLEKMEKDWNDMAEYKYGHDIKLKPGVKELLMYCKNRGIKLGIATSNSRVLTMIMLKAQGLDSVFDYVLTGCDSLKSKPDPEIYLTAAKALNVEPSDCMVFEDIVQGIMAGKNAGMTVVAVDDPYSQYCITEKQGLADYYLYSYEDIFIDK